MMPRTGRKGKFGISSGIFPSRRSLPPSLPAFFCHQEQLYLFCCTHVCLCYQNLRAFLLVEKSSRKLTALQNTLPFHDVPMTKLQIVLPDLKTTRNIIKSRVRNTYICGTVITFLLIHARKKMVSRTISPQPYQAPIHALHTHQFLIRT